ncbi:MAG TPA: ATP-binding protein [Solirubrobacterales bacterium]|nr:ATP-binding protein [Solirubrobacterales bacterium]
MLSDSQILRSNPWWAKSSWEDEDPHLRRLGASPIRLDTPQVEEIEPDVAAIHVLRGPRQTGKSTDLKLLARRALQAGTKPRDVIYLSLDLLEGQEPSVLVESVNRALELAAGGNASRLLLLDEVTAAGRWQTAVKALWDEGRIDRDVVICTGSSVADLAEGAAERLPGRRGRGRDFLILPQDFGSFARASDEAVPPAPGLTVAQILADEGREAMREARVHLPVLQRALERYLLFGGLPAAVVEAAAGSPEPSKEVERVLWDSLVKEVQRRGASIAATQALLERLMRSLGSKLSWSKLAREMDVPLGRPRRRAKGHSDPRTVQSYVELLAVNYFALVVYFWKQDSGSGGLAKDKKVYFGDPLLSTITARRVGLQRDRHAEVENALALALYRRYEPYERSAENMISPEALHVWGTRRGGEVDFVCGPRGQIDAVEVADWAALDRRKATAPARALPGRPSLVASREELDFGKSANVVPAALLLWALSTPADLDRRSGQ